MTNRYTSNTKESKHLAECHWTEDRSWKASSLAKIEFFNCDLHLSLCQRQRTPKMCTLFYLVDIKKHSYLTLCVFWSIKISKYSEREKKSLSKSHCMLAMCIMVICVLVWQIWCWIRRHKCFSVWCIWCVRLPACPICLSAMHAQKKSLFFFYPYCASTRITVMLSYSLSLCWQFWSLRKNCLSPQPKSKDDIEQELLVTGTGATNHDAARTTEPLPQSTAM